MADKNVVEIILKAVDQATKPIQDFNKKLNQTLEPTRKLGNSFQALEKAAGLTRVSKAFGEFGLAAGNLKNQIVGTATTFVTATTIIGGGLAFIAKGSIETADNLLTLSKETGVSVEGLQRLRFIASQTGSNTEDLDNGVKKFTVNLGLARAGQGQLFSILSRVNPAMLQQLLHAKDTESAFTIMLGVIRQLPKAQQQAALSQIAFGRGNLSLVSTAKAGSEEYAKLSQRLEEIGIISKAQAEQANETADAWSELSLALQRARDAVVLQALPALKDLAKTFTQFLIDNKAAIQAWGKEFAQRLPEILTALVTALRAVGTVLSPIVSLFAFMGRHTAILNVALAFLGEIFILKLAFGIYQAIKAFAALNLVILGTPIGWILLAITALVAVTALLYTYWDDIVGIFKEAWLIIKNVTESIWGMVRAIGSLPSKVLTSLGITNSSQPANVTGAGAAPVSQTQSTAAVKVSFDNLPKGARVSSVSEQDILDLTMGYAMQ